LVDSIVIGWRQIGVKIVTLESLSTTIVVLVITWRWILHGLILWVELLRLLLVVVWLGVLVPRLRIPLHLGLVVLVSRGRHSLLPVLLLGSTLLLELGLRCWLHTHIWVECCRVNGKGRRIIKG